jgi:hypothetical protein
MKKIIFIKLGVILLITFTGMAQCQPKADAKVAVAETVEALRKLMINPDSAKLSGMVSAQLTFGHSSGKVQNKQEFLRSFISGDTDFTSLEFTDQTIQVAGSTAIVRHTLTGATNDKGKASGTAKLMVILVMQKVKGQWILLARQAVKPPVAG